MKERRESYGYSQKAALEELQQMVYRAYLNEMMMLDDFYWRGWWEPPSTALPISATSRRLPITEDTVRPLRLGDGGERTKRGCCTLRAASPFVFYFTASANSLPYFRHSSWLAWSGAHWHRSPSLTNWNPAPPSSSVICFTASPLQP